MLQHKCAHEILYYTYIKIKEHDNYIVNSRICNCGMNTLNQIFLCLEISSIYIDIFI